MKIEMDVPCTSTMISRDNLCKFNYPYKKKSKRMIKKFAKENGLKFIKHSTKINIVWSDE